MGRHVSRNFGTHGIYNGLIASYNEEDELTFRVEYTDGDEEDLSADQVHATLIDLPTSTQKNKEEAKQGVEQVLEPSRATEQESAAQLREPTKE